MSVTLDAARTPPGLRLYAIGDVHGRLDLLAALHRQIRAEIDRDQPADWRIVHLGDYVDRGPDSAGVLDFLIDATADPRIAALAGNHDEGFLRFLADAEDHGLFSGFGGAATAASYGATADFTGPQARAATRAALLATMPEAHRAFLAGLPDRHACGDYFLVHAGVKPGVALVRQKREDLLWIRREFLDWPDPFDAVIVHGHTPSPAPQLKSNRVGIDTMAFASGRLTAFAAENERKWLIEAALR